MKSILYSVCIGSLALALTTGGAQAATEKRPERAKPQPRAAKGAGGTSREHRQDHGAHRNVSATQSRQLSNVKPRTSSAVNRAARADVGHASYSSRTKSRQEPKDA